MRGRDDRVLDPGCGSGTFLIYAYRRLSELKLRRRSRRVPADVHEQILRQLWGIDVNEFPAHLTAVNLAMRNPLAESKEMNVFVADFFDVLPGQPRILPYKREGMRGEREKGDC